jgi:hypothetical protein
LRFWALGHAGTVNAFFYDVALATCFASRVERRRPLPVDALIPEPIFTSTHAITIDAPPERVWPWIAQMGAGRAGWYSWDAIDNGGTPSATSIMPAFQTVVSGDMMPAIPGGKDGFVVAAVDPPQDLVLTVPDRRGGSAVAWGHVLDPLPGGRTRLIVRGRASSHWLDLARATPPAGHRRIFIERAYAALAKLPRPLLIPFAALGHRMMEARHLRGIQRRSTAASARREVSGEAWRKALLVCGIASSLLYAVMIWAIRYEGYNPVSQVPSELTAIGAPTQRLWALLGPIYTLLVAAFGWGIWRSAGRNRPVRTVGGLILAYASLGLLWPFAVMHQREVLAAGGGTLSDTMHVVLGAVTVFLMFLAIGFGARAFGKRFRLYSIASIVVLLAFGTLTFLDAPRLQANLPTPWIGLWERINISVFLLWVVVLATVLLRKGTSKESHITQWPAPERIQRLVLLSPGGFLPMVKQFSLRGMLTAFFPTRFTVNSFMRSAGFTETDARPVLDLMYLGTKHFRMPKDTMRVNRDAANPLSDNELRSLHMPVLLLFGDGEVIYDSAQAVDRARRLIPHFERELIPRCRHDMCFRQSRIVDARVLDFLKERGDQPADTEQLR